jgi:hypothetical protein
MLVLINLGTGIAEDAAEVKQLGLEQYLRFVGSASV